MQETLKQKRSRQVRDTKALVEQHLFETAGWVADLVIASVSPGKPKSRYIAPNNVARAINRKRADRFPTIDTTTFNYDVKLDALPGKSFDFHYYL